MDQLSTLGALARSSVQASLCCRYNLTRRYNTSPDTTTMEVRAHGSSRGPQSTSAQYGNYCMVLCRKLGRSLSLTLERQLGTVYGVLSRSAARGRASLRLMDPRPRLIVAAMNRRTSIDESVPPRSNLPFVSAARLHSARCHLVN